jgi:hypothetical protein
MLPGSGFVVMILVTVISCDDCGECATLSVLHRFELFYCGKSSVVSLVGIPAGPHVYRFHSFACGSFVAAGIRAND